MCSVLCTFPLHENAQQRKVTEILSTSQSQVPVSLHHSSRVMAACLSGGCACECDRCSASSYRVLPMCWFLIFFPCSLSVVSSTPPHTLVFTITLSSFSFSMYTQSINVRQTPPLSLHPPRHLSASPFLGSLHLTFSMCICLWFETSTREASRHNLQGVKKKLSSSLCFSATPYCVTPQF